MACSADSGKPFNGMGVTRTSPAVLCGRQAGHEFGDLCTHAVANDDNRPRRPALERIKHDLVRQAAAAMRPR
jgi:hypothetical protein